MFFLFACLRDNRTPLARFIYSVVATVAAVKPNKTYSSLSISCRKWPEAGSSVLMKISIAHRETKKRKNVELVPSSTHPFFPLCFSLFHVAQEFSSRRDKRLFQVEKKKKKKRLVSTERERNSSGENDRFLVLGSQKPGEKNRRWKFRGKSV